jgi:sporadic carbohydrate cluster 2OG-Fe(II) oxygenase
MMFFSPEEIKLINDFERCGYIIRPIDNADSFKFISDTFLTFIEESCPQSIHSKDIESALDSIHKYVPVGALNDFRLKAIDYINRVPDFRSHYYKLAKSYLDTLVGNELAMQKKVNLSIQFPMDDSSLLAIHADTWSGDSPFEVVVWIPLVNCFGTKAMYILGPSKEKSLLDYGFNSFDGISSEDLFKKIENDVEWLTVNAGEVLIFNQALPHGNRINLESETRWSMNCRFKGIFTPYADKKLGEFFEPITLRPASKLGLTYNLPKVITRD